LPVFGPNHQISKKSVQCINDGKDEISLLVNSLKGVSCRMLRKEFPDLEKYYWKGGLWSPSHFIASCGGAALKMVTEFIEKQ
jgi:putative transposase